ncbi:MAG: TonB-dependent receptor [Dysgonamonadaceae bacterium]|nr:TonB-dependent receptor [Dysgonamonadaceae bacterium]
MMKKYIFTILSGILLTTGLIAQQPDTLLRRQLQLEREFNPTLQDANKIRTLPTLPVPEVKKANISYSNWGGRITPPLEIAIPVPSDIMTAIPFDKSKGYASLSAGNYANIDGALGFRIISNEKNDLRFDFNHYSTNGVIKYSQESNPQTNKAFLMDDIGQLRFNHYFKSSKLNAYTSYLHSMYNYYGNSFGNIRTFNDENQKLKAFNLGIELESTSDKWLQYKGYADYKNFSTKYGSTLVNEGIKGNQFNLGINLNKPIQDKGSALGINGELFNTFYGKTNDPAVVDYKNYSLVKVNPYIVFEGLNWRTLLGVNVMLQQHDKLELRLTPNIELGLKITDHSSIFANLKGGYDNNTFLNIWNESRYITPTTVVKPSITYLDINGGIKIGELDGFRFDILGGYKRTDNEHFFILDNFNELNTLDLLPQDMIRESLSPAYAELTHSYLGGMIQSNIWAPLEISVHLKKNFYKTKNMTIDATEVANSQAYNMPGWESKLAATYNASNNLKFTLNYYYANDRWSYLRGENVKMNNINDLNIGASYLITPKLSLNLKANNLLSQEYDIWYGYPAQGLNMMGGVTLKF